MLHHSACPSSRTTVCMGIYPVLEELGARCLFDRIFAALAAEGGPPERC